MKKCISTYIQNHPNECKLQIGTGQINKLEGWLNTDYNGPIYLDAGAKFVIEDNTFDYIFCEHLFEHLTLVQASNMLSESYRILKPGGVLRIATPDYQFLTKLYNDPENELHQRYIKWAIDRQKGGIFIPKNAPAKPIFAISIFYTPYNHQVVYDYDTLSQLIEEFGFSVKRCEVGISEHLALHDVERHQFFMPAEFNLLETMVLEATKI